MSIIHIKIVSIYSHIPAVFNQNLPQPRGSDNKHWERKNKRNRERAALVKPFHNSNWRQFVINENIMVKVKSLSKKIHKTSNRKDRVIFLNLNDLTTRTTLNVSTARFIRFGSICTMMSAYKTRIVLIVNCYYLYPFL